MSTCWSLGRAAWLPSTPELPDAGLAFGGFTACAGGWGWGLSSAALTAAALVTLYFPFLSAASHVAWALCWGGRVKRSCGAVSLGRGLCQLTASPSPFCFLNLSRGCASCRNFCPSGWQPLQVPAWGGLAAMEKAERQKDTGSSCLTVHGDADPTPFTSLPRTNTRVLLFRKKKLSSSGQQQGFFSSAPTIVWPLVLKSASLASEPETKRNRICLYPAQQMVVVIAKALINPSGLRRVQSWLCRLHLLGSSPLPPFLNSEVGTKHQVPADPPAVATPECSVSPCVRALPSPQIQCLAQDLAVNSMLCMFPTPCLRS